MTDTNTYPNHTHGSVPVWAQQPAPHGQMPAVAPPPANPGHDGQVPTAPAVAATTPGAPHAGPMQPTHAAPQAPYQYPQTQTKPDNGKIVAAYICAVISILLLPIILGPVAIYLAHSAEGDGHPGGKTAKGVAIVCMILGFALGALVYLGSQ